MFRFLFETFPVYLMNPCKVFWDMDTSRSASHRCRPTQSGTGDRDRSTDRDRTQFWHTKKARGVGPTPIHATRCERGPHLGATWPRPARRTYIGAYRMRVSRRELTQEMRQRGPHPLSSREAGSKQATRGPDPNMQPGFFTIWYFWKTNFTNRFLKTYPENSSSRAPSSCHRSRSALRWQGEHANVAGTPR